MSVPVIADTVPVDDLQQQTEQLEAIVEILTPSEEEIELEEQKELDQQEIVEQQQELLGTISEDLKTLVTVLSEDNEEVLTETASTNEILLALTQNVEEMNALVQDESQIVHAASSTVVGYGILYVPLLIIVIGLWWFFKQFLTDFR